MKDIRKIVALLSLPAQLTPLPGWHVSGDTLREQLLYSVPTGADHSALMTEIQAAFQSAGFVLEHAERQDSHYALGDVRLSFSLTRTIIESKDGLRNEAQIVIFF